MKTIENLKKQASLMNIWFNVEHDPDFITITVRDMINGNAVKEQMSQHMYLELRYQDNFLYEIIFNLIMKIIRMRLEEHD